MKQESEDYYKELYNSTKAGNGLSLVHGCKYTRTRRSDNKKAELDPYLRKATKRFEG